MSDCCYIVHSRSLRRVKIGIAKHLDKRFRQLEREYGELELVRVFSVADCAKLEAALHWWYARQRIAAPVRWAEGHKSGDTEFFSERVLDSIMDIDPAQVMKAFKATRVYEVRLNKDTIKDLKQHGLSIEDAIHIALGVLP